MKRHYSIFIICNKCIILDESILRILDSECLMEFKHKRYLLNYTDGIVLESNSIDEIFDEIKREDEKIVKLTLDYYNDAENEISIIFSNENYSLYKYPIFISMQGEVTNKDIKLRVCDAFNKLIKNNVAWYSRVRILCDTALTIFPVMIFLLIIENTFGINLLSIGLILTMSIVMLGIKRIFESEYNEMINFLTPRVVFNVGLNKRHEDKNKFIRESIILAIIISLIASFVYSAVIEFIKK